jgi:hypothetical protein
MARRITTERDGAVSQTRRRRRHRPLRTMTSPSRCMPGRPSGSPGMYATSVTATYVGRVDNATPCALRQRFRASATRRGSAERPRVGSPWPIRRMRARRCASMHGRPGRRRERRLQHPRTRSRCQRATVAGWTSTSASLHRGHHRRKHSQNSRSDGRKRRSARARTPSWWRSARHSRRRSLRVDRAVRSAATVRTASRIARKNGPATARTSTILDGCDLANDSHSRRREPVLAGQKKPVAATMREPSRFINTYP